MLEFVKVNSSPEFRRVSRKSELENLGNRKSLHVIVFKETVLFFCNGWLIVSGKQETRKILASVGISRVKPNLFSPRHPKLLILLQRLRES